MGKPKGKGLKLASNETGLDIVTETLPAPRTKSPLKAADGHNVDGWADEDIRTYNELLTEREKLEKEKNELEQKSSRHQTQRALLDENATALDRLFKSQIGGDFKFTGSGKCCLDFDAICGAGAGKDDFPCKHELCRRSKTKGVSWMEMDTIKYYHARILSEKSQRMQSALRKQRDVELVRVKKDDDEEAALRARRNAILDKATRINQSPAVPTKADKGSKMDTSALDMLPVASKDFLLDPKNSAILEAAKENEHIVRRIRGRLDKIRHDVNAGRVSPADARVKLDQANSEMAEAERKNNEFRQMILDAEPALSQLHQPIVSASNTNPQTPASLTTVLQNTLASTNADAFSQALSVMKGFFSASDPQDVQTAITDLRSVLELNGPMSPVLQKSFRALEDMLAKPNAKGFTVDVTTSDGTKRTCSNVVEVMLNLRLKMHGSDPSAALDPELNLDDDTVKANLECIKVEDAAKKDMLKISDRMAEDSVENVTTALKKIKAKAILKSPIPPLSDIVLDDVIADIFFRRSIKVLTVEAAAGATLAQLSGKLTSLIISTARNKPEKYLSTLESAKDCIDKAGNSPQVLLDALSKVDTSMPKFVAAHEEKLRKSAVATAKAALATHGTAFLPGSSSSKPMIETKYLLEGSLMDSKEFRSFANFLTTAAANNDNNLRAKVFEYYHRNLEEGVWDVLRTLLIQQTEDKFTWADFDAQKRHCIENLQLVAAIPEPKIFEAVTHLQSLGICPGRAAILVAQRMALQIRENFEVAKEKTLELKIRFADPELGNSSDWIRSFNFIAQTMTDLFGMLVYTLVGEDPIDTPILAADLLGFICSFVLGSMDAAKGEANLRYLEKFVLEKLMDLDSRKEGYKKVQDCFHRFGLMCQDSLRFRCPPDHTCQTRFRTYAKEKIGSLLPAPLKVKKDKTSPASQNSSGLSREEHFSYLITAYWDVAQTLTPHLKCLEAGLEHCSCTKADRGFGEEILTLKLDIDVGFAELGAYILEERTPPKELWDTLDKNAALLHERPATWPGNQKRLEELRKKLGTSLFSEPSTPHTSTPIVPQSLPHHSKAAATASTIRQPISLKQVPVSVPDIQNNMSSNNSEKGKLEKPATTADSEGVPSSATTDDPFPMTAREKVIRDQLLKFSESVDKFHVTKEEGAPVQVDTSLLDGVAWRMEEMLVEHVKMAYLIAKAQGYNGLKAWIESYYKDTMPEPLGEDDEDDEDDS